MKKKILSLILLLGVVVAACKEDPYLTLESNDSYEFTSAGGTVQLAFSTNQTWSANASQPWCSLSASSGDAGSITLTVSVAASDDASSRRCSVTVSTGAGSFNVGISQEQKDIMDISSNEIELENIESRFVIETKFNIDYTVRIEDGATWLTHFNTKTLNVGQEIFIAQANRFVEDRSARIYFEADGITNVFTVKQKGYVNPVLKLSVPAILDIEGVTETYIPGTDQTSISRGASESVFRLLKPSEAFAMELGGIPSGLSAGDMFTGGLSIVSKGVLVFSGYVDLSVLKVADGLAWLSSGEEAGIVVKI